MTDQIQRVAIYARYSSDLQSDNSIEDQVRLCERRIEQNGWQLAGTYTDHALSGANTLRPGYQALLEDARSGKFDIVIAEALDRLSRDQEDVAALYKQLTYAGVTLLTLAEGEISELHVGFTGTLNAIFLKNLAQKTRRGLEGRIRQGRSAGGRVYGYDVVKKVDDAGEPVRGFRRVNEAEAEIIRRIFGEFAAGRTAKAIAFQLNAEGVAGPNGRPWQGGSIRGHSLRRNGVLRNELYVGRLVWNRQHYVKDPSTGRRVPRLNPETEWIIEDVPHLRIIDDGLWRAVGARLDEIRESPRVQKVLASKFWEKRRPTNLLTGLVTCASCGGKVSSIGGGYLACSNARKAGTCENRKGLRRSLLEDAILDTIKHHLMHPDLVKEFITAFHQEANQQAARDEVAAKDQKRELGEVSRRLDGLIEAIADGLRSPGINDKLQALERKKRELTLIIGEIHPTPRFHPRLAELYSQHVTALNDALQDPKLRDEALGIIRGLIDHIEITPAEGGFQVEFVGDIANLLTVGNPTAAQKLKPFENSAKRVSGARKQRESLIVPLIL